VSVGEALTTTIHWEEIVVACASRSQSENPTMNSVNAQAHSTGYKLANDGHDTRSLAHYLGHRNLQSTARYTALAPDRFAKFWGD